MTRPLLALMVLAALLLISTHAQTTDPPAAKERVGIITTVAGSGDARYAGDGGPATRARLSHPRALAIGPDGGLYIADSGNHRIRKVDPKGIITTVAGNGVRDYAGDGGPATAASLNEPWAVAVATDGSVYIGDSYNHRIRCVGPNGTITTLAGDGVAGYSGDGGPATKARLQFPAGLAVGAEGSLYIADSGNHRIRKVDPKGMISTVVGDAAQGYSGDGGPAAKAGLNRPMGITVGRDGSLYIADSENDRIRKVDGHGIISTVAGGGYGVDGDTNEAGPATKASLFRPSGVAVSPDGSLFIAEESSHYIRRVDPAGIMSTVAGTGRDGLSGDGGPASSASLRHPSAVAIGPDGSLYIADTINHRIRKVTWK